MKQLNKPISNKKLSKIITKMDEKIASSGAPQAIHLFRPKEIAIAMSGSDFLALFDISVDNSAIEETVEHIEKNEFKEKVAKYCNQYIFTEIDNIVDNWPSRLAEFTYAAKFKKLSYTVVNLDDEKTIIMITGKAFPVITFTPQ